MISPQICSDSSSVQASIHKMWASQFNASTWTIFLLAGLGFTLLGLVLSQNQIGKYFFEDLLHPIVRKLFLHLKENVSHLQSGNHCRTWQLLVAFEI